MLNWMLLAGIGAITWAIYCMSHHRRQLMEVQYLPGPRPFFSPFSLLGALLPTNDYNPGLLMSWVGRYSLWERYGSEIIALVPLIPGRSVLYTRSVEVAKQILAHKSDWDKVPVQVDSLACVWMFGENLFSTYQDQWQRHRRIVAPGFRQALYEKVWNESIRTYYDMTQTESWFAGDVFVHPDVTAMASKIALYLVASCGFGMALNWKDTVGEQIGGLTLNECFRIASSSIYVQIFLPKWAFRLPVRPLQRIREANQVLESILRRIIEDRRNEYPKPAESSADQDVFSLLVAANEREPDLKDALTDDELVSNVFLLMVAGHETTSHALASALGLLACHPDIQNKAHSEVMRVAQHGDPTFQESDSLIYTQACFLEAIRIFSSVSGMPRRATRDTILRIPSSKNGVTDLHIRADQYIVIDLFGACYDSRHYLDPGEYRPERWLTPGTDPNLIFGDGPRVCVGRKFALKEGTAILTMLVRHWFIEPVLKEGETLRQWRQRSLEGSVANALGFGPTSFPLRFRRRR